ncbi:MAG TPA: glycosyl transferase [Lachnospiraceae bacterium]|nr:glycosyl transferase [Lachnospiraceae bacterium]HIS63437.1 glycosyltransferase [Candidatus Scybalomonas excrementigallinarum]
MKLITFAVPCYNSESYMRHCVDSLLEGGEEVEILIVDDGSKDGTAQIADEYASKYPTIVRAIHQENGGHGEAVNTGLLNATGYYYKVVDSDDWVNKAAYHDILEVLRKMVRENISLDMLLSNFVYEKQGARRKKVMSYRNMFPQDEVITWDDMRFLKKSQYILMHSVIYRTELLRECGLKLPKHTFYVDNIFVYQPLPYVKTIYYLDVNFYRYFIGRGDQSVNEKVMIGRIDQQIRVTHIMLETYNVWKIENKKLRKYMMNYLDIMMMVSSILLIRSGTDENFKKKQELWKYLKNLDRKLYRKLRYSIMGRSSNLPGKGGRKVSIMAYQIVRKFYGFN